MTPWVVAGIVLAGLVVAALAARSRVERAAGAAGRDSVGVVDSGASGGRTFVFVRIPEPLQPVERGDRYEDPLHEALQRGGHGEVTGGGSSLSAPDASGQRRVEWVGLDVELVHLARDLPVLKSELVRLGAPRGTVLEYERDGAKVEEPLVGAMVPATDYPDPGQQVVTEPDAGELAWLDAQRAAAAELLASVCGGPVDLSTPAGTLRALQAALDSRSLDAQRTAELQSLGIVLGDVFVAKHGWQWVTVTDSYGRDPALRLPGTTLLSFPRTMISKRVENGERFDVAALCDGIAGDAAARARDGR
jgi:hypothetical protein